MADAGFNGSTMALGTYTSTPLRSMSYDCTAAEVPVHGAGSTQAIFVDGIKNATVTFEIVGATPITTGDTGAVTLTWNDGGNDTFTTGVVTAVSTSGSMDGEITSSITIKPAS